MKKSNLFPLAFVAALLLFLLTACGGAQQTAAPDTPSAPVDSVETADTPAPSSGVLRAYFMTGGSKNGIVYYNKDEAAFGSPTLNREEIRSITFLSDASQASGESWDASQAEDGSVIAWAIENGELYDLYIAADGGVIAPNDSHNIFRDYSNVERIDFNSAFDTSGVTLMYTMFEKCYNLTELDVSGFDTSNVIDMMGMFSDCKSLTTLDVSGFDTSNVTDMRFMFDGCVNLTELNISGFDTSNVEYVAGMFADCPAVTEEDISGWNLSKATDANEIFGEA